MASEPGTIRVDIQLNPGEHPEERDQLARALRAECAELPGVARAELAHGSDESDARGDPLLVGQLAVQIAPALLEYLLARLADWQRREPARRERIVIDIHGRRAEFPEDIDSERLAALISAVEKGR